MLTSLDIFDWLMEGFNFNYLTEDDTTYSETIRTGLSTHTNGFEVLNPELTFFFGKFTPYIELTEPTQDELVPDYLILEIYQRKLPRRSDQN